MKLNSLNEDKNFFNYEVEANKMWREKIKEAQNKFKISFDTENDDTVDQRNTFTFGNDDNKVTFHCEMYSAGGDWQHPLRYFRCELRNGYVKSLSQYSNPHFIFIPDDKQGNVLVSNEAGDGLTCPDNDDDDYDDPDDNLCWESLENYLEQLV